MFLITGASGNAGGAVLHEATALHLPVRAMYRSREDAARMPANVEFAVADFADQASLPKTLENVTAVYLVCGPIPQLIEYEGNMIDACRVAGVRHVVLNSALGAGHFDKSFPKWHAQVEERLKASGLSYTIIRPNGFMQNIVAYNAATIRTDRAFYAAMSDAQVSLIDVRDIGAAVAGILKEPERHAGMTYELNGPEALSNTEIAERVSRVAGAKVTFVDIPEPAQRQAMLDAGMPAWQVDAVLELQEYYRSGACAAGGEKTASLLGRPLRDVNAYLEENAAAFRPV